jgi:serine/threonine protein phosphatase PrpC
VIVRDAAGDVRIGPLHNTGANPQDAQRAVERGALLVGPYLVDPDRLEGVNLTRTIGDSEFPFLGRSPEVLDAGLGAASFVLVASDGVFTRATPAVDALLGRVTALVDGGAEAAAIVDDALAAGSDDNVTAVLWRAVS